MMLRRIKGEKQKNSRWQNQKAEGVICMLMLLLTRAHVVHTFQLPSARKVARNCKG